MASTSQNAIVLLVQAAVFPGVNWCDAFQLGMPLVNSGGQSLVGNSDLPDLLTPQHRPHFMSHGHSVGDPVGAHTELEDESFNTTEWDLMMAGLLKRKRKSATASTEQQANSASGVCMSGVQVPTVYVIGAQKAGTTTLAFDLMQAGLRSGIGTKKELHMFDDLCGQRKIYDGNKCDWVQNHSNYVRAMRGRCEKATEQQKLDWRHNFTMPCVSEGPDATGPLADMTPKNIRIPGLPRWLSDVYGAQRVKLRFIVMLRDPLKRLHSGYHYVGMKNVRADFESCGGFSSWVAMACDRLQALQFKKDSDISRDFPLDALYRSMYSLNLRPWLQAFSPQQFTIILSTRYLKNIEARRGDIQTFAQNSGAPLDASEITQLEALNVNTHPSLAEDLSPAVRDRVQREVFDPDAKRLSELLAPQIRLGLTIAGYKGPQSPGQLLKFLQANW